MTEAYLNDWPKEIWKKRPIIIIQTVMRVRLSNSESTRVFIHTYCTIFPVNKYFTCFTSFFVGILFSKAEGPGPCHWPLVYCLGFGALSAATWPQSLAGNPSPTPSHCRPRPSKINYTILLQSAPVCLQNEAASLFGCSPTFLQLGRDVFSQPEKRKYNGQNNVNSPNNRLIPPTGKVGQFISQWA